MKTCKFCNGTGTSNICINGTFQMCPACNGKGEYADDTELFDNIESVVTNDDYITSCTTEERAEILAEMLIKTVYAFDGDIRKVEKKALLVDVFETWLNYKHEESLPMPWEYGFAREEKE